MQIVVLGATGQLGRELVRVLPAADTVALGHADLDVTDHAAVATRLRLLRPAVVINATAENRVDAAEDDPIPALALNADAVRNLGETCRALDCFLVHVSTDYVFDGTSRRPYREDDSPHPLGAYGRSKRSGEKWALNTTTRCAVVRVAGLYAAGGARGKGGNFVDKVLAKARAGEPLRIVADQITAPTYAQDVAASLTRLLPAWVGARDAGGIFHLTNAGECSWYEFARAALELADVKAAVHPITTAELGARAPRPAYSVLANTRVTPPLRHWREALAAYLAEA